jgi:ABC-type amino acid transport substrate-binding protein
LENTDGIVFGRQPEVTEQENDVRRLAGGALFVVIAALSGTAALACGDKLLAIGRGLRFQRADAAHEANLVVYSAGTQNSAALTSAKLQTTLRRAVHRLQLVQGGSELDQALKTGRVDVMLIDFTDIAEIRQRLQSAPSKPVILPILVKPSKAAFAAAQKEYKFALRATADDFEYLTAIDEAMKLRLKTGARP